jgi:hypothetical protein
MSTVFQFMSTVFQFMSTVLQFMSTVVPFIAYQFIFVSAWSRPPQRSSQGREGGGARRRRWEAPSCSSVVNLARQASTTTDRYLTNDPFTGVG